MTLNSVCIITGAAMRSIYSYSPRAASLPRFNQLPAVLIFGLPSFFHLIVQNRRFKTSCAF